MVNIAKPVIFMNLVFLLIWRIMVIQMNLTIMANMEKLMIWMILVNMVILIQVNLAACGDSHE